MIHQHIPMVDNFEKCVFAPYQSNSAIDSKQSNKRSRAQPRHRGDGNQSRNVAFQGSTDQYGQNQYHMHEPSKTTTDRCLKSNHTTLDCFHQIRVQCYNCKCYGHKDFQGLCWNLQDNGKYAISSSIQEIQLPDVSLTYHFDVLQYICYDRNSFQCFCHLYTSNENTEFSSFHLKTG